ncbi:Ni-sirohydrochlorin a,c-diamide synthase [Methanimicrococcus blatticola]|uniref:Cobyrinate a,c-diamide synthase n=1 Tax=Methanimicrococcus blatticola TaxID=91560 RepID=A0A484F854_9EURY|nr:Ni-sirohydrochlorin a,c-diamide synthase [Methanimicrococcus blatticola]MBZ3935244.1 Ni-sirohydrochlorin a,c-diamide synthase [Methanimicrococcus blatticola]MCC2508658.1 Ni-sirohydrochlorin a,c-diamide synthase [Methanimicrococcus blatticola]TDQ71305.1 hydrogenobyrinic acid a,c-diamide synthase (glutamine-hydrolysing) /cobyrinate a,c-diamide synthase [Methanimicrococcus blatticola]
MTSDNRQIPRILISADRSSSGKTTISMGIMAALKAQGYVVQPFKVALDYIDPEYHTEIVGRRSRNLDGYLMEEEGVIDVFTHACNSEENDGKPADIAVIEGVRGLYEGLTADTDMGSTAQISKMLKCPVIMVINARSMTRSCAALIKGFASFDSDVNIAGVILNNVGSQRHADKAVTAIESTTGIPVIGVVYRNPDLDLWMRELGLIPIPEGRKTYDRFAERIRIIENTVRDSVDLEKLIQIANTAGPITPPAKSRFEERQPAAGEIPPKIGVAFDEAFNFYYPDNMDLLQAEGAEIELFSPLHDSKLPDVDALYIGGGTPEIFALELSLNTPMKEAIEEASAKGMPIFAESAGMNYLTKSMTIKTRDAPDVTFDMVGIFDCDTVYGSGKRIVTYTNGVFEKDTPIGKKGNKFIAHEFHHSILENISDDIEYTIDVTRGIGIKDKKDGMIVKNTIGTYIHYHGSSYTDFAKDFVESARKYHKYQSGK